MVKQQIHSHSYNLKKNGFSLLELIIVLAVITMISAVALAQYERARTDYDFDRVANDVLFKIREVQVYSISSHEGAGSFDYPYGVFFNINTPTAYNIFRDTNANGQYDGSPTACTNECIQRVALDRGYSVSSLCTMVGASFVCSSPNITVSFMRPSPRAIFNPSTSKVGIVLQNVQGKTQSINISLSGLIEQIR